MFVPALVIFIQVMLPLQDQEAKTIVGKAIDAAGNAKLVNFQGCRRKGEGYALMDGQVRAITVETVVKYPDFTRQKVSVNTASGERKFSRCLQGGKGWIAAGNTADDAVGYQLFDLKEAAHVTNIERLTPLLSDRSVSLSMLPPESIPGREVSGVRVSKIGFQPVDLYFDKSSWLLVKTARTKHRLDGKTAREEVLYLNYQECQGMKVPATVRIVEDGVTLSQYSIKACKFLVTVDEHEFYKPWSGVTFGRIINFYK